MPLERVSTFKVIPDRSIVQSVRNENLQKELAVNLNVLNNLAIRGDGVVTVATTLEPVTPPARNKYVNSIWNVMSEHIPKHFHGFPQCLLIRLSFDTFRFSIRYCHYKDIGPRIGILHVLISA